jgi:predicted nucleotidyltransferase
VPADNQQKIVDRIAALLKSRDDVEALWLSGSLGAGEGDEWSDVDFLVLSPQDKIAALPEALKAQMRDAFQTVFSNDIFGRVLNFIAPDWTRFDLNLVTPPDLARFDAGALKPLFNKGTHTPPVQPLASYAPPAATVEKLSTEFLRVLGLSSVALGRGEYDVLLSGLDLLRRMTIDLMLEENAVPPARRGGALKRNPFLSDAQRADLAQIPAAGADRRSLMAAHEAIARIFLARAKTLCTRTGAAWPDRFERATRTHLMKSGMEI